MKSVEEKGKLRQRWHNQAPRSRKDTRRIVTTLLGAVISLAVVAYLVEGLDWQTMHRTFVNLDWTWLLMAWLIFTLNYILRTIRFRILLSKKVPFLSLFPIASLHGMLNYLLPSKSGEISFPLLLNHRLQVPLAESTATLVTARFFDFATIAFFLPIVLLAFQQYLPLEMIYVSLAFCGLFYVLLAGVLYFLKRPRISCVGGNWEGVLGRLKAAWLKMVEYLRSIDQRGQYWRLWLITIGIWLCVYTNLYLILLSIGYNLSYAQVIVVNIITVPTALLPFRGFANMGTHEVSWVAALMLFGKTREMSLSIAVSSHVILLLFVSLMGLVGLIISVLTRIGIENLTIIPKDVT